MKRVDNRDFVVAYMNSKSLDEVAKVTGMKDGRSVSAKATYLRKMGVKLPKLYRSKKITDELEIAQLNSLIKKYSKA